MLIAKPRHTLTVHQNRYPEGILLKKNEPYIMAEGLYLQIKEKMKKDPLKKFSKYYKPLPKNREIRNGDKLLVWRTGGIGDILFITTILNHIKINFPDVFIKFGCGKQYQNMLYGLDFIDEIVDLPIHLSHLLKSDYSIIFENIIENNPEAEKINCYELMSGQFNINFKDVKRKYPVIKVKEENNQKIGRWLNENGLKDKKLILIHQRASSPIRTPTVHFSSEMVKHLVDNFSSDYHFLLVDMPARANVVDKYINTFLKDYKNRVTNVAHALKKLELTVALVNKSSCVVGVDSSMIHFAAGLEIPAVGLYGPFKSELRAKYYPRCIGMDTDYHCAPCFRHGHEHCQEAVKINGGIGAPCFNSLKYEDITSNVKYLINKFGT